MAYTHQPVGGSSGAPSSTVAISQGGTDNDVDATIANAAGAAAVNIQDGGNSITIDAANLDVALSTRLKAADTLAGVTTVGTITNVVHVDDNAAALTVDGTVALSAGSAVIGHVITDATSVTIATLAAETTKVIGTINVAAGQTIATTNNGTFAVQSTETRPATPVVTLADFSAISDTTRALTILAANAARRGATIRNDTDTAIRIQEGGTASATSYTDILPPGARYVLDYPACTALISAYLPQIPDGRLFVTERA